MGTLVDEVPKYLIYYLMEEYDHDYTWVARTQKVS
jgi:hypothetical protein